MSAEDAAAGAPKTGQKRRSPIERAVVWSLIGLLVLVVAYEAWVRSSFTRSQRVLREAVAGSDQGRVQKIEEVERQLSGSPSKSIQTTRMEQTITYQWRSLFRKYIVQVHVGDQNEVLSYETD